MSGPLEINSMWSQKSSVNVSKLLKTLGIRNLLLKYEWVSWARVRNMHSHTNIQRVQQVHFPWHPLSQHKYAISTVKRNLFQRAGFITQRHLLCYEGKLNNQPFQGPQFCTGWYPKEHKSIYKSKRATCGQLGAWKHITASERSHQEQIYCYTIKVIGSGKVPKSWKVSFIWEVGSVDDITHTSSYVYTAKSKRRR